MKYERQLSQANPYTILAVVLLTVFIVCGTLICVGALTDSDSDDDADFKAPKSVPTQTATKKVPDRGVSPTARKTSTSPRKAKPVITKKATPTPMRTVTKKATPTPTRTRTTSVPVKTYANCTELRQDYPAGVPVDHKHYQKKMDRDNDGTACEPS